MPLKVSETTKKKTLVPLSVAVNSYKWLKKKKFI